MDLSKWVEALEREDEIASSISCPACGPENNWDGYEGQQAHAHLFENLEEKNH